MSDDNEDDEIGRLLRAVGPREQLPAPLQQRWERLFRDELQAVRTARMRRRGLLAAALAAGIAAVAASLYLLWTPTSPASPLVRVATVAGDVTRIPLDGAREPARAGQLLAPGDSLLTQSGDLAALAWAGYDLRVNRDTRLQVREDGVYLHAGEIYVSDNPNGIQRHRLSVHTPRGTFRDIGTQFSVRVNSQAAVATVRRGAIALQAAGSTHRAEAGQGIAQRLSVHRELGISVDRAPASGADWQWIYRVDPGFALEGRSALDFLNWSVGESGLQLAFATPAARTYARETRLHGSVTGLDPEQAVAPVLAATDLRAEVEDGVLRVTLRH